jgi:glycosyltransferase involved in cell wall biosynthesis
MRILIIGVFHNSRTKNKIPCSVPEQLSALFEKNSIEVIKTSKYLNRAGRFFETVFSIIFYRKKYDIAIVPWYNGIGSFYWQEIASRLLKVVNKKIILVLHGGGIPDLLDSHPLKYLPTISRADLIVCPSTFIKSRLQKHKIESVIIENGLNLSRYPFVKKEKFELNILWMRTLEPLYNPAMALEVARVLKEKKHSFTISIAGQDNGELKSLQQLQTKYGLENEVKFCGLLNHEEKLKKARECDLYICTNLIDNAPVSFIEMMSLGLPIVSNNVGGIPHFLRNLNNGFLVDVNNAEQMADKLIEIHLCPSIGKTFANNGYKFSRRFDESKVIEKWNYHIGILRNIEAEYNLTNSNTNYSYKKITDNHTASIPKRVN